MSLRVKILECYAKIRTLIQEDNESASWLNMIELLRDEGVDIDNIYKFTLLRVAIEHDYVELIKMLTHVNDIGDHSDIAHEHVDPSDIAHEHVDPSDIAHEYVDPSSEDNEAIRLACELGRLEIVKILLQDDRVDPSTVDNEAFRIAVNNGFIYDDNDYSARPSNDYMYNGDAQLMPDTNVFNNIHQYRRYERYNKYPHNVSDDAQYYTLIYGDRQSYIEIVRILLQDERCDPSSHNNAAIRYASLNGLSEMVKMLLECDYVDPSANNNQAIQYACMGSDQGVVDILFRYEYTAITQYMMRCAEVVKLLLICERVCIEVIF